MTAAEDKALAALELLKQLAADLPSATRLTSLTETMVNCVENVGQQAILPVWLLCDSADDSDIRRSFSYLIARYAVDLDDARWVPLLWLLSSPGSCDDSGLINTLTALQQHPAPTGIALAALRTQIGIFLVHAVERGEMTMEGALEVIAAYARERSLQSILLEADVARIVARLRDVSLDGVLGEVTKEAIEALAGKDFPAHFEPIGDALREWVSEVAETPAAEAPWSAVISRARGAARDYAAHFADFDELAQYSSDAKGAAFDLRVDGRWASAGLLPIDFLQKLLSSWRRFYSSVRDQIATNVAGPQFFVLAPARGSFATRVLVTSPEDDQDIEGAVASTLAEHLSAVVSSSDSTTSRGEYVPLLNLVAEHGVNLDLGVISERAHRVRERIFVTAKTARRKTGSAPAPSRAGVPIQIVGTLDAANHRSGQLEILPADGSDRIKAAIQTGGRNILLNKTIGQLYTFDLICEGSGDSMRWILVKLRREGSSIAEEEDLGEPQWPSTPAPAPRPKPKAKPARPKAPRAADGEPRRRPPAHPSQPIDATVEKRGGAPVEITSESIAQVDNLTSILAVVKLLASGQPLSTETLHLSQRHVDYRKQAARTLDVLNDADELTAKGKALGALSSADVVPFLVRVFETSRVGEAWIAWSGAKDLAGLDPNTAEDFLRNGLGWEKEGMIERRGRTLRTWASDLKAGVLQPEHARRGVRRPK